MAFVFEAVADVRRSSIEVCKGETVDGREAESPSDHVESFSGGEVVGGIVKNVLNSNSPSPPTF